MSLSGNKQRLFTDESKREAVGLMATGVQQIANDLGISKLIFSWWRPEHERGEGRDGAE
jgi:transposase-like protein